MKRLITEGLFLSYFSSTIAKGIGVTTIYMKIVKIPRNA